MHIPLALSATLGLHPIACKLLLFPIPLMIRVHTGRLLLDSKRTAAINQVVLKQLIWLRNSSQVITEHY